MRLISIVSRWSLTAPLVAAGCGQKNVFEPPPPPAVTVGQIRMRRDMRLDLRFNRLRQQPMCARA